MGGLVFGTLLLFVLSGCAVVPQPYSQDEFMAQAKGERGRLYDDQEPVKGRLTLHEAMARAIRYNLDHKVKQIEKALASGNLELARYELLPQMVSSLGYTARSNDSDSASLSSGLESTDSVSAEKRNVTASIITVWNVLDFGVGYTTAMQQADEVLVSEEWRRKAVQNIVQDVRYAFWRAASAEMLIPQMDRLLKRVESALERARKMEQDRAQDPAKTLSYQQELLETVKQLWTMRKDLSLAKTELAALMNLDPGSEYTIGLSDDQLQYMEKLLSLPTLEEEALAKRPELRVEAYQKRISALEVKKTMLGLLPGFEISVGANFDDNKYLYNQTWLQAGLNLSWNVFNLLSAPSTMKSAELQQELAQKRYMASAMMVLTQVNLAHQGYYLALKEYQIADELDAVHRRKLLHVEAAKKAQTGSELEEIKMLAGALSAHMNKGVSFAELQGALGRVFHSSGIDPLPHVTKTHGIKGLAQNIAEYEKRTLASLQDDQQPEFLSARLVPQSPIVPALASEKKEPEQHDILPQPVTSRQEQAAVVAPEIIAEPKESVPVVSQSQAPEPAETQVEEKAVVAENEAKQVTPGKTEVTEAVPSEGQEETTAAALAEASLLEEQRNRIQLKSASQAIIGRRMLSKEYQPTGLAYRISPGQAMESEIQVDHPKASIRAIPF